MHLRIRHIFPRKVATLLAASLLVFLNVSGCNEGLVVQQLESSHALIPLALGNRWTYVDSVNTGDLIQVDTVTAVVESVRTLGGYTWWQLRSVFNPSIGSREFSVRNDSVFSLQYTKSPAGLAGRPSLEYVKPASSDTATFTSHFGGDVTITKSAKLLRQVYASRAGVFLGAITFDYLIYPERYHEVLVPGLGVISCEIVSPPSVYGPGWSRSIQLLAYQLPIRHAL